MAKVKEKVTANRVFALLGLVAATAAAVTTFQTSLVPGSPAAEATAKALVLLGSLGAFLAIVWKFMEGAQRMDKLTHEQYMQWRRDNPPVATGVPTAQPVATDSERMQGFTGPTTTPPLA